MRIATHVLLAFGFTSAVFAAKQPQWVVTWGTSPAPQLATAEEMRTAKLEFEDQTIREIVHTSIGSQTVRVRLSNAFGKRAVEIGAAHVALRAKGPGIVASSDRVLTFGGRAAV